MAANQPWRLLKVSVDAPNSGIMKVPETNIEFGSIEMTTNADSAGWKTVAVVVGRLIFVAVFAMAVCFKLMDINATAGYIMAAGFPMAMLLTWLAVIFELALVACLLTGAYFSEAALLAAVYVLFLGCAFHGPSHWAGNQNEFGFFVDHFSFIAGLLFAAAYGPGRLRKKGSNRIN